MMTVRYLGYVFCLLILAACGGGSSSNNTSSETLAPAPAAPSSNVAEISERYFSMSVDQVPAEGLGSGFPELIENITQEFRPHGLTYLQTDSFGDWQYQGEYQVDELTNNRAVVSITIPYNSRQYRLVFDFDNATSGQWQGEFHDGTVELSGSFSSSSIPNPREYQFKGTIISDLEFSSTITDVSYPYHVYLPAGYEQSSKDYPVYYVTDGQWEYWQMAHAIDKSERDIILVAIEQGANDRRIIDYAMPGSKDYLNFLRLEMIPLIESSYRIDSTQRALSGASWGGLIVRHAFINEAENPLFSIFVSMDGSYWHDNGSYTTLEQEALPKFNQTERTFYLSSATIQGNNGDVARYFHYLNNQDVASLSLTMRSFDVEHNQVGVPSFRDVLVNLY